MTNGNAFDMSGAREYRKKGTALAFRMESGLTYDKKAMWGSNQPFPGAHWLLVGPVAKATDEAGGAIVTANDVYGCADDEFKKMYEPASTRPHEYRKTKTVRAVIMDAAFAVTTVTSDKNVEAMSHGVVGDALVLQPGGERQLIEAEKFEATYELARAEPGPSDSEVNRRRAEDRR